MSWPVDDGVILIGGEGSDADNTSEIVRNDGTNEPTFNLQYSIVYVIPHYRSILEYFVFRRACSIADDDSDSVIITGGQQGNGVRSTVSRYNQTGWISTLPSLKQGRQGHGCGSYESGENMVVSHL